MKVLFFADERSFRMDAEETANIYDGKSHDLRSFVISENDRLRMEYHHGNDYAYIREKSIIQDGNITERCDPRVMLSPSGGLLSEFIENLRSGCDDLVVTATQEGSVVFVRIESATRKRSIRLEIDLSLSGAITKECYFMNGREHRTVVREFAADNGSVVPRKIYVRGCNTTTGEVSSEITYVFREFQCVDRIDQQLFTLSGMEVPDGVTVVDRTAGDAAFVKGGAQFISEELDKMLTSAESVSSQLSYAASETPSGAIPVGPQADPQATQTESPRSAIPDTGTGRPSRPTRYVVIAVAISMIIGGVIVLRTRRNMTSKRQCK